MNGDEIAYEWYAPDGIVLDNPTSATPSFTVTDTSANEELSFLVSVSDGYLYSTDVVTVNVQLRKARLDLKVILEGPYLDEGVMATTLYDQEKLPREQPYDDSPWNYLGMEEVTAMPPSVVDWVLVTARTEPAKNATVGTAAFMLRRDGQVIGLDGELPLLALDSLYENLYLTVYHRNHVGVMTASLVSRNSGLYKVDFTTGSNVVFGGINAIKDLGNGFHGLFSADADGNGQVQISDMFLLFEKLGLGGYYPEDFDLNSQVQNSDLQENFFFNVGKGASFEY